MFTEFKIVFYRFSYDVIPGSGSQRRALCRQFLYGHAEGSYTGEHTLEDPPTPTLDEILHRSHCHAGCHV